MSDKKSTRWRLLLVTGASFLVTAGALLWAGLTVLQAPGDSEIPTTGYTTTTVSSGSVESDLTLTAVASRPVTSVVHNRAGGIVTSVDIEPAKLPQAGHVAYTVNARPIVLAEGAVPTFRQIRAGDTGIDVRQVQDFLRGQGFLGAATDGRIDHATVLAIQSWQRSLGIEPTGTVEFGDILFVPTLTTPLRIDTAILKIGQEVRGGEPVIQVLAADPQFSMTVTAAQAAVVPNGARVEITSPHLGRWQSVTAEQVRDEKSGNVLVRLASASESVICGASCDEVPLDGDTRLVARVVLVERLSGLTVPSAALGTDSAGATVVVDEEGTRYGVTLLGAAKGVSVIEGVQEGLVVRLPARMTEE